MAQEIKKYERNKSLDRIETFLWYLMAVFALSTLYYIIRAIIWHYTNN